MAVTQLHFIPVTITTFGTLGQGMGVSESEFFSSESKGKKLKRSENLTRVLP